MAAVADGSVSIHESKSRRPGAGLLFSAILPPSLYGLLPECLSGAQPGVPGRAAGLVQRIDHAGAGGRMLPLLGRWADRTGRGGWMLTGALGAALVGAGLLSLQTGLLGALLWGVLWETARDACVSLADKGAVELCEAEGQELRRRSHLRLPGLPGRRDGHGGSPPGAGRWSGYCFPSTWRWWRRAVPCPSPFTGPPPLSPWQGRPGRLGALFRRPGFRLALLLGVQGSVAVSALQPSSGQSSGHGDGRRCVYFELEYPVLRGAGADPAAVGRGKGAAPVGLLSGLA